MEGHTTYYRALLQRHYPYTPQLQDKGRIDEDRWCFFNEEPDEFIINMNLPTDSTSALVSVIQYRIKYLHIIHEQDFKDRKIYSKPIDQIIFH